jgi:hypothetical protein
MQRRFYLSSEEKCSNEEKNSSIEEKDLQEVINEFQKKHAERKKRMEFLIQRRLKRVNEQKGIS